MAAVLLGATPALAADGDITATVDTSTGTASGTTWTSTDANGVVITKSSGNIITNGATEWPNQNVGISLIFGTDGANTNGQPVTVTISPKNSEYYVSSYSMSVRGISGDPVVFTAGSTTVTSGNDEQTFSVSDIAEDSTASFTIVSGNSEELNHDKKAILSSFTVTLSAKSTNSVYTPITRNAGWSVTGCSSAANENGSANKTGDISNVIDENPATYWHNDWNACSGVTDRHFFILDLGEESEFDACSFLQRSDDVAWNGAFAEAKIFVSSEAFADISHNTISSYLEANTPSLTATIQPSLRNEVQYFDFPETQTGRYLLVVASQTSNPGNGTNPANKFACLAEFNLYTLDKSGFIQPDTANAQLSAKKEEALAALRLWNGILSTEEIATFTSAINSVPAFESPVSQTALTARLDEVEAAFSTTQAVTLAEGRVVTIKNVRRNEYLTNLAATGKNNTMTTVTERGKWVILRDNADFILLNPEAGAFLAANDVATTTTGKAAAARFQLGSHSAEGAVAIKFTNNNNGLNVDTGGHNLVTYDAADNGSSWVISAAGTKAADLATDGTKYYRIRSNRATWDNGSCTPNGSLLGILTVAGGDSTGAEAQVRCSKDGIGSLWTIEATDTEGQVYLRNAAADFTGQDACFGLFGDGNTCKTGATPSAVMVEQAKGAVGSEYTRTNPYALSIRTTPGQSQFLDMSNGKEPKFNGWSKVDNNQNNNGGIFYFEEATDAAEVINAYIAGVTDAIPTAENAKATVASYGSVSALWDEQAVEQANSAIDALTFPTAAASSVKEANDIYSNPTVEGLDEIINTLIASADGKMVQFENAGRNNGTGHFMGYGSWTRGTQTNNEVVNILTDRRDLNTFWIVTKQENTNRFYLQSHGSNRYIGSQSSLETAIPTTTDFTQAYGYDLRPISDGLIAICDDHASYPAIHDGDTDNSTFHVVKWNTAGAASQWRVAEFEDLADQISVSVDGGSIYFTHETETLAKHESYSEHHVITVTNAPEEEGTEPEGAYALEQPQTISANQIYANTNPAGFIAVVSALQNDGRYTVTVPAGFFKVGDDKLSAPVAVTFEVNNGETTGISDITADGNNAPAEYFNLQGVRVDRPEGGVFIMRQGNTVKKVYVK